MHLPLDYATLRVIWWGLMGVLLIGGAVALVYAVVARVQRGPAQAAIAPGPRHVEALLPAGARVSIA